MSDILSAKQSADIKAKQESRAKEIKQILDKLPKTNNQNQQNFKDYLPSPLDTV